MPKRKKNTLRRKSKRIRDTLRRYKKLRKKVGGSAPGQGNNTPRIGQNMAKPGGDGGKLVKGVSVEAAQGSMAKLQEREAGIRDKSDELKRLKYQLASYKIKDGIRKMAQPGAPPRFLPPGDGRILSQPGVVDYLIDGSSPNAATPATPLPSLYEIYNNLMEKLRSKVAGGLSIDEALSEILGLFKGTASEEDGIAFQYDIGNY